MSNIKDTTLTEIVNVGYRSYAMYVLESRAIPSVIDGFKPVQRKVLYAMLTEHGGKKVKLTDLGSISRHNYHHAETSAVAAAVGMAASWSNNLPIFKEHSSFGSRLVQDPPAPRYIYTSLSDAYSKVFVDAEVAPRHPDIENPEPAHYLPIIPWILLNGVEGIAVGFRCAILPRSAKDVIAATRACIRNPQKFLEAREPIPPTFPSFTGTVTQLGTNQWRTTGRIEYVGKYHYEISELPMGYDRDSYVTLLNEMCAKELIKDYSDECSRAGFGFRVKVSLTQKEDIDRDPIKYFKLEKSHTEILTTMGSDGKLKIFNDISELVHYFCEYRLVKFDEKLEYERAKIATEILHLGHKISFIQDVIDGEIPLRDSTKQDMLDYIAKWITTEPHGTAFVNIPIHAYTVDQIGRLRTELAALQMREIELKTQTGAKRFQDAVQGLKI